MQRREWECYFYPSRSGTWIYGVIRREPLRVLTKEVTYKDDRHFDDLIAEVEGQARKISAPTTGGYL